MEDVPLIPLDQVNEASSIAAEQSQQESIPLIPLGASPTSANPAGVISTRPIVGFSQEKLAEYNSLPFEPTEENVKELNMQLVDKHVNGFNLDNFGANGGTLGMKAENDKLLSYVEGLTPNVNYETGVLGTDFSRAKLSQANTLEEKIKVIEDHFGVGTAGQDDQGRLTYLHPVTGNKTAIDELSLTPDDIADWYDDAPELALTIAAAAASGGSNLWVQALADSTAYIAGRGIAGIGAEEAGANLESAEEWFNREKWNAALVVPTTFATGLVGAEFIARRRNPLYGSLTERNWKTMNELARINEKRVARGVEPLKFLSSALNEAPGLARMEGILAKLPLSSWIYNRRNKATDEALNEEAEFMLDFIPGTTEEKVLVAEQIKGMLKDSIKAEKDGLFAATNVRYTGGADGKSMIDGVQVAVDSWRLNMDRQATALSAVVGDNKFIPVGPTSAFKKFIREELKNLPLDGKTGKVSPQFGSLETQLKGWLNMEDKLSLPQWHSIRNELGKKIKGDDSIMANMDVGRAKQMYATISKAMDRVAANPKVAAELLPAGVSEKGVQKWRKDLKQFNDEYKSGHELFVDKGGALADIAKVSEPWEIANFFLRKNNVAQVKELKKVLPRKKWLETKDAAVNSFFFNQDSTLLTPKVMQSKLNGIGKETVDEWLGKGMYQELSDMTRSLQRIKTSNLNNLVKGRNEASKLFDSFMTKRNASTVIEARKRLGKDSKEWRMMQQFHMSNLLEDSFRNGVLDGQTLLNKLSKGEKGQTGAFNALMFEGTPYLQTLKDLGDLSIQANKSKSSLAGGLAAGMIQMSLLTGNIGTAGTAIGMSWLASKVLTSKSATKWLTNKPLTKQTKVGWRAFNESLLRLEDETDDVAPALREGQSQINSLLKNFAPASL